MVKPKNKHSLSHVRHDPAHCLAPGLFRALKRGERKPGHEADYIERTVSKVMGLPSVQLARAELARAPAPRQRGMDRGGPDFSM